MSSIYNIYLKLDLETRCVAHVSHEPLRDDTRQSNSFPCVPDPTQPPSKSGWTIHPPSGSWGLPKKKSKDRGWVMDGSGMGMEHKLSAVLVRRSSPSGHWDHAMANPTVINGHDLTYLLLLRHVYFSKTSEEVEKKFPVLESLKRRTWTFFQTPWPPATVEGTAVAHPH